MYHGDSHGVRKDLEDMLDKNIVGGAYRVPTDAKKDDLRRLPQQCLLNHLQRYNTSQTHVVRSGLIDVPSRQREAIDSLVIPRVQNVHNTMYVRTPTRGGI